MVENGVTILSLEEVFALLDTMYFPVSWIGETGRVSWATLLSEQHHFMVRITNKTGEVSVKGKLVSCSSSYDNSVSLTPVGGLDSIGVIYEAGIADGKEMWVVTGGRAQVLFCGNVTRGQFARMSITGDTGEAAGLAKGEAMPTTPFATDNHFREIGHINESKSAGELTWCFLHFN